MIEVAAYIIGQAILVLGVGFAPDIVTAYHQWRNR